MIPHSAFLRAVGYEQVIYGIGEIIGILPMSQRKKQALYLGSRVRYQRTSGRVGTGQITRFSSVKDIGGGVLREDLVVQDVENGRVPLRFDEIKEIYVD
jgi:ribosomal protein L35AE/L33A